MDIWVKTLHRLSLVLRGMPVLQRYGINLLVVALATVLLRSSGLGHDSYAYLAFLPIVLLGAAVLDRGNGFFATVLGAIACVFFIAPNTPGYSVGGNPDNAALVLFLITGFAISFVVEALHVGLVELAVQHDLLRDAAHERDILLGELTHRTRNDLASVATLLQLQARSASEETKHALAAASDRVQTIARVHRRLELRDNRVVVDSQAYIEELCADLRITLLAMRPIALECHAESHRLGVEKIVPLGLIVNESITNSVKHAFPSGRRGVIKVEFARMALSYRLIVSDDGIGSDGKPRDGALGNKLMQLLAGQLGSHVEIQAGSGGTLVRIDVPIVVSK
jgi:two-component system, sensor histidine kinase PdtaS